MKTQAWGWLVAGVVALGLNGYYQDGGAPWAHQIVERMSHDTQAVIALATGHADRLLAEARLASAQRESESCPWATTTSRIQARMDRAQAEVNAMSARRQAQLDRFQAQRNRMEAQRAQIESQIARMHVPAMTFTSVDVAVPNVDCPRIRIRVPRPPQVRIPAPAIHIEPSRPDML
jgi:hypothetical protein